MMIKINITNNSDNKLQKQNTSYAENCDNLASIILYKTEENGCSEKAVILTVAAVVIKTVISFAVVIVRELISIQDNKAVYTICQLKEQKRKENKIKMSLCDIS